ncbi:MAG: DeoR/GlpR transcriptional regulator [Clostridia bacterium]|nr:DeoR/GlpR transcriptional regulator [Clostridia bacterium]
MQKQRQEQILQILDAEQYATVQYLTHVLGCSTATVNRDLNAMQQMKLVKRCYGGVEAVKGGLPPLPQRQFYMQKEKRQNAQKAAGLIQNGDRIFLDASTTVQHIVPFLADKKELTVITNSLFLATELTKYEMEIICLGGQVSERPYVLDGEDTVENALKYRVDKMFFSLNAVTLQGQVGASHYLLYKTVMNNSKERYLLTDCAKVAENTPKMLCDFSALSGVISDFAFPPETQALYPSTKFIVSASENR